MGEGWVPSNTHPSNTRIVASSCDTLYITRTDPPDPAWFNRLESLREQALPKLAPTRATRSGHTGQSVDLAGRRFTYYPAAHPTARHRLHNQDMVLLAHPHRGQGKGIVRVQLRSSYLWLKGWSTACAEAQHLADQLFLPCKPLWDTSRVDLCADFQGWRPTEDQGSWFIRRSSRRTANEVDRRFTGWTFGRSPISCRIYDKTLEINHTKKGWMRDIWRTEQYAPEEPVWRLEFQLMRKALRQLDIDDTRKLEQRMLPTWAYLTEKWLRLTMPGASARIERSPTHPYWEALQSPSNFNGAPEATSRSAIQACSEEHLVRLILGCLTSYSALRGLSSLPIAMASALQEAKSRLKAKGTSFADEVEHKAIKLGITPPQDVRRNTPNALCAKSQGSRGHSVTQDSRGNHGPR